MQPHTGATIATINYFLPTLKLDPERFKKRSLYVKTSVYNQDHRLLHEKKHDIRTEDYNSHSKMIKIDVGRDYACYMDIIHDASFEWFEFVKHRHTHIREKFRLYQGSENFQGEYISEAGFYHKLSGKIRNIKLMEIEDTFILPEYSKHNGVTWTYKYEILNVS